MNQEVEYLRLDRDGLGAATKLAPLRIEDMVGKQKFHSFALDAGP
jgi:hypothetical protein